MAGNGKKKPDGKKLTPKRQRFVENYIANGGNGAQAARDAGYAPETANKEASRLLTSVDIRDQIARRVEAALNLGSQEVVGVLAQQMRADIGPLVDYLPDGPMKTLMIAARDHGLLHLLKKVQEDKDGRLTIETYSSQSAATQLCKVLGLEQEARENEHDARIRQRILAAIERIAAKHNMTTDEARALYLTVAPEHERYIN